MKERKKDVINAFKKRESLGLLSNEEETKRAKELRRLVVELLRSRGDEDMVGSGKSE